ncbi:flagellar motor protein MotB [Nocardioides sp.]|uniref:flagellar motor protein MotB n=1 Tax=Nocardioides sp. TaxID=35761 RepID=UPI00286C5996|nr:flagellar motor protein MotB [Nocardioides sp.]
MSTKRRRLEEPEEHENHERWLVTYADMVTLLMVLFIVLFAMSQVDQKKFNALKDGLAAGFGQSTSVLDGSSSILDQAGTSSMAPVAPALNFQELTEVELASTSNGVAEAVQDAVRRRQDAEAEVTRFEALQEQVLKALRKKGLADDVQVSYDERGLVLSLVSRHVVFEADLATLSTRGREVVDTLATVLADVDEPLQVDGHTNQVKVKPKYFASDWDLSAARALTVLRRLDEVGGLPGSRLMLAAYGHEKPLVDPDLPGSQEVNKRVDVVVLSSLPSETRAMLDDVVASREGDGS